MYINCGAAPPEMRIKFGSGGIPDASARLDQLGKSDAEPMRLAPTDDPALSLGIERTHVL